jgi:hypothetical protein
VTEALLGTAQEQDVLTKIYRLAQRYEVGDWDEIERLAQECGIPAAAVGPAYMESTLWAERLLGRQGG